MPCKPTSARDLWSRAGTRKPAYKASPCRRPSARSGCAAKGRNEEACLQGMPCKPTSARDLWSRAGARKPAYKASPCRRPSARSGCAAKGRNGEACLQGMPCKPTSTRDRRSSAGTRAPARRRPSVRGDANIRHRKRRRRTPGGAAQRWPPGVRAQPFSGDCWLRKLRGFTTRPFSQTSKCTWAPVERPVEPALAISCPARTSSPTFRVRRELCA